MILADPLIRRSNRSSAMSAAEGPARVSTHDTLGIVHKDEHVPATHFTAMDDLSPGCESQVETQLFP